MLPMHFLPKYSLHHFLYHDKGAILETLTKYQQKVRKSGTTNTTQRTA